MPLTPDVAEVRLVRQGPLPCLSEHALLEELRVALDAARVDEMAQAGFAEWSLDAQLGWVRAAFSPGTTGAWVSCGQAEVSLHLAVVDGRRAEVRTITVPLGPAVEPDLAQGTREVLARLGVAPSPPPEHATPAAGMAASGLAASGTAGSGTAASGTAGAGHAPATGDAAAGAGAAGAAAHGGSGAKPLFGALSPELVVGASSSWVEEGNPSFLFGGEVASALVVGPVRLRAGLEARGTVGFVTVGPRLGVGLPFVFGPFQIEPALSASYIWSRMQDPEPVTWWSPELGASAGVHWRMGPANRLGIVAEARLDPVREFIRDRATGDVVMDTGRHGAAVRVEWTWLGKVQGGRRQDGDG